MNVSLTPELEKLVQKEVAGGLNQTAREVVRAALRRLKEDKFPHPRELPRTLESPDGIEVFHVYHSARNISSLLRKR